MPVARGTTGARAAHGARRPSSGGGPPVTRFDPLDTMPRERAGLAPLLDPLHRLAYAAGFRAARILWNLTHPRHEGALVAVLVGRSMLLLQQSYRPELAMPGGGVASGEAPVAAARRELAEELDLLVPADQLREVHRGSGLWDGRHDTVTFFEVELGGLPTLRLDGREVVAAALVPMDEIELGDVTPAVGAYLAWRRGKGTWPPGSRSD